MGSNDHSKELVKKNFIFAVYFYQTELSLNSGQTKKCNEL